MTQLTDSVEKLYQAPFFLSYSPCIRQVPLKLATKLAYLFVFEGML